MPGALESNGNDVRIENIATRDPNPDGTHHDWQHVALRVTSGSLVAAGCHFTGAVILERSAITLEDCHIHDFSGTGGVTSGQWKDDVDSALLMTRCTIRKCGSNPHLLRPEENPAALQVCSGTAELVDCTFTGNGAHARSTSILT